MFVPVGDDSVAPVNRLVLNSDGDDDDDDDDDYNNDDKDIRESVTAAGVSVCKKRLELSWI